MAVLAQCPVCKTRQSVKKKVCKNCSEDLDKAKAAKRVTYWISYRLPSGKQKQEPVGKSIEEARAADGKKKGQKKEGRLFDIKPDAKMTFKELADWYLELETVKGLASFKTVSGYVNKFNREYGKTIISKIRLMDLENLQEKRKKEGLKPKTIDDEINYVKTMIIKAFYNDIVGGDVLKAFQRVKPLLRRNSNARDRVLSRDEYESLVLYAPNHLKRILIMAYWTGMRKRELKCLTWDKVDMQERIIRLEAEDTKEGKPKTIPLGREPYRMLRSIPRAIHDTHVFLYQGKPIQRNFSTGLKTACKEAGITWGREVKGGFIFHDIRHTFVTNMRKAGVSKSVRMSITGHAPKDMDDRYNRVDIQDQHEAIKKLEVFFRNVTQSVNYRVSQAG
ncbi:MAG: site-specific integrase [Deltaproteobacteria bacterium]|nr:site-specific integrase [Deltaproteobacteria bacterium]